ncbi:MAG: HAD family hydrolase, partial [Planctomycetota bacterium]
LKPDPAPVRLALRRLGVDGGWMLGDTVDDVAAARAAGVVPIGVVAPGDDQERAQATLAGAGAARVLLRAEELGGLLR